MESKEDDPILNGIILGLTFGSGATAAIAILWILQNLWKLPYLL